jgi:glycosyltransferase involved in cell wall biosynthesis
MQAMLRLAPQHEFVAFGDEAALAAGPEPTGNLKLVAVPQSVPAAKAAAADGYRSPWDMLRLSRAVARERPDVFFSPSVYSYFPLPIGQRAVVTIHDAIAERFPSLTLPSRRARIFWKIKVGLALRQARLVLTVSEYAAREIQSVHRVSRDRLRIALEAPAEVYSPATTLEVEAARGRVGIPDGAEWFTYVGGFSPHKRLDVILQAHAALMAGTGTAAVHLVLVGRREGDVFLSNGTTLEALARDLGTTSLIHWTGFLPDEELRALHTGAVASLLPSESEGFGLPAVEAAACGTPVVATTESPLPELLVGGGIFVQPGDIEGLTKAMRLLVEDRGLRASLGAIARERADGLSWDDGARAALAALEEAAA